MDIPLAVRIIRDVYNRCGFAALTGVFADTKGDSSPVTDIDPLVEHVILQQLAESMPDEFACVREEAANDKQQTIKQIKKKSFLVTIDGIDGTGDFIRHFNRGEANSKWLVGMTAVYERVQRELYEPRFAFALQPNEDRLFVMAEQKGYLIRNPLGRAESFELHADRLPDRPKRGSLDVFLDKPDCDWELSDQSTKMQTGPSGFNTAALAASAAPFGAFAGSDKINFTTFHYNLWDFGLWPVLHAAGVQTVVKEPDGLKTVKQLNLNWFGEDANPPEKCDATPIILSKWTDYDPFEDEGE